MTADAPPHSRKDWEALVRTVLERAGRAPRDADTPADQALRTTLQDGIVVPPLHTAAHAPTDQPAVPGAPDFRRGGSPAGGWELRQRLAHPDPERLRAEARADLDNGADALWFVLDAGLPDPAAALPHILAGLPPVPVVLEAGSAFPATATAFLDHCAATGTPAEAVAGNLGADPTAVLARGGDPGAQPELNSALTALARRTARHHPRLRAATIDALPYHDAGASPAEELGCSLAAAVSVLRTLTDEGGLLLETALGQLEFRYAATADQFLTLAKLRAARLLWGRVVGACGAVPDAARQRQHAVGSAVELTRRAPWVNMLRATAACMGAVLGGADAVTVRPFDEGVGVSDPFARRIARNTQSILRHEAALGRVIDPAGGSWYVERLTVDLARRAWEWFQEIEAHGGLPAALRSGLIADRLAATWRRRRADLDRGIEPVTGVSAYPDLDEKPLHRTPHRAGPGSGGLGTVRRAEGWEALRDRAAGRDARVTLTGLGLPAGYRARLEFATRFFAAGGFRAADATGTAPVVCLCPADDTADAEITTAARTARTAGARRVLLARRPAADPVPPGVDGLIHQGCDAIAVLTRALDHTDREESSAV